MKFCFLINTASLLTLSGATWSRPIDTTYTTTPAPEPFIVILGPSEDISNHCKKPVSWFASPSWVVDGVSVETVDTRTRTTMGRTENHRFFIDTTSPLEFQFRVPTSFYSRVIALIESKGSIVRYRPGFRFTHPVIENCSALGDLNDLPSIVYKLTTKNGLDDETTFTFPTVLPRQYIDFAIRSELQECYLLLRPYDETSTSSLKIIGEPLLRTVKTVFDTHNKRVGFC